MSFGENLIALRESMSMSRGQLAAMLEIPYTTLRNYETDQREPGHKLLIKIATLFSVSVDDLIGNHQIIVKPTPSTKDETLLHSFHQLNEDGQNKLIDTADDLVQSGKYVKASIDSCVKAV